MIGEVAIGSLPTHVPESGAAWTMDVLILVQIVKLGTFRQLNHNEKTKAMVKG